MDWNFRGVAPRTEYGLSLRGKDIALEGGQPSFSTVLSEGDKRTLAFAFFVASTLADSKLSTRVVIIDDPMCSLDLNRKHHTRSVLKRLHSKAEQLILLAHDPYFLRDLRDALRKEDPGTPIATFQLSLAANDYTGFSALEIDKECESAYFQHHRLLNELVAGSNLDAQAVAKAIRPMLEGYLHRRFPSLIPKSLMSFNSATWFFAWLSGLLVGASRMQLTTCPNNSDLGIKLGNLRCRYPSNIGRMAFATAFASRFDPAINSFNRRWCWK